MRIALLPLCVILSLCGCTHVPVTDSSSGHHSLTAVAPSGGYSGSREQAIEEANAYCAKWHEAAVLENFDDQPELGPHGEHTSRLLFSCAPPLVLHF